MSTLDFKQTILSNESPEKVFQVVTNVRSWWSGFHNEEFEGNSEKLHDEFSFKAGNGAHYSKQQLIEVVPNQKIVWLVIDSHLSFLKKPNEWTGTKVIFEITTSGEQTLLSFTHQGLTPEIECYNSCAPAWSQYLKEKLKPLV